MLQWVWPGFLFIGCYLAPESPWWLCRQNRLEEAAESLKRLATGTEVEPARLQQKVAGMIYTTAMEKAQTASATYWDCFRGDNLRRTEISCAVWAIQWWCGNPLIGQAVQFFQRAGLDPLTSFNLNLSMNAMYIVGTIIAWGLMSHFGRRTIYIWGLVLMAGIMLSTGILGFFHGTSVSWTIGGLLIFMNLAYNISVGPVCYSIVAEMSSTRLRAKSIVLARNSYNLTGLITNTLVPRMLSPAAWNWGAKCGLFFMGTAILSIIYCYFRLPETKGRTFAQLDLLFEHKVSARNFKTTRVDQFATGEPVGVEEDKKQDIEHIEMHRGL